VPVAATATAAAQAAYTETGLSFLLQLWIKRHEKNHHILFRADFFTPIRCTARVNLIGSPLRTSCPLYFASIGDHAIYRFLLMKMLPLHRRDTTSCAHSSALALKHAILPPYPTLS
jgi:hypothetical protein